MRFCVGYEVEIKIHILLSGFLVVSEAFVKKGIVSLPNYLDTLDGYQ